jgi:oxygen-independent coproporphyrinogen-3 oxidase
MKPADLALYIHWPFCKSKCPYCDFNSHVRAEVDAAAFGAALQQELRWQVEKLAEKRPITSIFFGGGTPSLMPPRIVAEILAEAEKQLGFAPDCEITLEANPTSAEAQSFRGYAAAGVNRLSLGVQSLTPRHLQFLGREHSAEEAIQAIQWAAQCFPRYSFDLIYALHSQSPAQWRAELADALALARGHLSLYQLTLEQGTQFYHLHQAGKLPVLTADEAAGYYDITQEMMEAAGMPAYEISNHAALGMESRHNLTYWRGGEYLGIGAGAHGRFVTSAGRIATATHRSPEKWLKQVQAEGQGGDEYHLLTAEEIRDEKRVMSIRLREGMPRSLVDEKTLRVTLTDLEAEGLITVTNTHLIPTAKGRLVLNQLLAVL